MDDIIEMEGESEQNSAVSKIQKLIDTQQENHTLTESYDAIRTFGGDGPNSIPNNSRMVETVDGIDQQIPDNAFSD